MGRTSSSNPVVGRGEPPARPRRCAPTDEPAARPYRRIGAFLLLWFIAVSASNARINVVTLPGRDTVQLTIYNSADLTLVKETRHLTFRKGLNKLEFSWANTLIDPTSVEFRALTHADAVEVLDVSFPPRVTNTLEWRIQSEFAGEVVCEIRYFTSGITWSADYVAEADKAEKLMALAGNVRVTNNSGEDYENAQVRLVVGVIRLVEEIRQLALQNGRRDERAKDKNEVEVKELFVVAGVPFKMKIAEAENRPREIIKEGMSEYFLYTVEGRDTIPTGWAKQLPSFRTNAVPIVSYYKFEKEQWNDAVIRFYKFTNDKPSHLGDEPLPDGDVKAFRVVSPDQLLNFVGATSVKYIPIGETVELELGEDREVLVQPTLMDWQKTGLHFDQWGNVDGWTIKEQWQFEVQNSKDIDVVLDVRRNFEGDWDIESRQKFEKVDASKVKFVLPLKSREKQKFSYELTTRYGTNVTK
ncbi:MAG: hypothetical protein PCFJNLEI_00920 [Verrucomicrobiae bacterium]|nr:hypothetical protein [Verrucomicrobiae bacterium]